MQQLETGMKLFIQEEGDADPTHELFTHIEEILPNEHLLLTTPIYRGMLYSFAPGEMLHLFFPVKDGICDFRCAVTERITQNNIRYLKARMASDLNYWQRRESFRLKSNIEGTITRERQIDGKTQEIQSKCRAADISNGGLGLYVKEDCEVGEGIIVSVPIGEHGQEISIASEVRWKKPIDGTVYAYQIGVQFLLVDRLLRDTVSKYIYELQKRLLLEKRERK